MSEVANQLKSQTLDEVISTSFNTVGGRVFPDLNASLDILDLVKIVNAHKVLLFSLLSILINKHFANTQCELAPNKCLESERGETRKSFPQKSC